jgi:hypothetical protein
MSIPRNITNITKFLQDCTWEQFNTRVLGYMTEVEILTMLAAEEKGQNRPSFVSRIKSRGRSINKKNENFK